GFPYDVSEGQLTISAYVLIPPASPFAKTSHIGHHDIMEAHLHSVIKTNYTSSSRTVPNLLQDTDKLKNTHIVENTFHPHRIEISERALIEEPWIHHASVRKVINYHIKKFDLIGRQLSLALELIERVFCCFAV